MYGSSDANFEIILIIEGIGHPSNLYPSDFVFHSIEFSFVKVNNFLKFR